MLLVAGKGHETGQIVGDTVLPFSDHEAVAGRCSRETTAMADAEPLWRWDDLVAAADGTADGTADACLITGFSIDTRTLAPGDVFVALKVERDGHEFVPAAFARGAAAALVGRRLHARTPMTAR